MFNFGIEGYRPQWLTGRSAIMAAQSDRLRALSGRTLTHSWLVWDLQDNEWFPDCPVLLDFDGEQVEINHNKFDDLSITWNTVDPHQPVLWPGFDFELQWRHDTHPELHALQNQALQDVELLEWTGNDMAQGTLDVSFRFPPGQLTIFNALDENGLTFRPSESHDRRHSLHGGT